MTTTDQATTRRDPLVEQRVADLETAVRRANEALNRLPWQGGGLLGYVIDGLDASEALRVAQVLEDAASALDPGALGLDSR
jgi:hypothetical protein